MCALCKEHVGDADSSINSEAMEVSRSVALGAAMELLANRGSNTDGIQELVMIINTASIQLRNRCKSCADRSEKIT